MQRIGQELKQGRAEKSLEIQGGKREDNYQGQSAKCVQRECTGSRRVLSHATGEGQINRIEMELMPGPQKSVRRHDDMRGKGSTESLVRTTLIRRMRSQTNRAEVRKTPCSVGRDQVVQDWQHTHDMRHVIPKRCRGPRGPSESVTRVGLALPRYRIARAGGLRMMIGRGRLHTSQLEIMIDIEVTWGRNGPPC